MINVFANIDSYEFGEAYYKYYGAFGPISGTSIQMVYMEKGNGTVVVDGEARTLKQGSVSLIIATESLEYIYSAEEPHKVKWCVAGIDAEHGLTGHDIESIPNTLLCSERMQALFSMGLDIAYTGDLSSIAHRNSLGKASFFEYLSEGQVDSQAQQVSTPVRRCINYIDSHLEDELTTTIVSEHVHFAPEFLNNLFKKSVGVSISQYIWQKRLDKSIELLKNTESSILEISEQCGFKNQQHFSRFIKQSYNQTPSEIRRLSKSSSGNSSLGYAQLAV